MLLCFFFFFFFFFSTGSVGLSAYDRTGHLPQLPSRKNRQEQTDACKEEAHPNCENVLHFKP